VQRRLGHRGGGSFHRQGRRRFSAGPNGRWAQLGRLFKAPGGRQKEDCLIWYRGMMGGGFAMWGSGSGVNSSGIKGADHGGMSGGTKRGRGLQDTGRWRGWQEMRKGYKASRQWVPGSPLTPNFEA